jgi:polysaccharide export outer membrane protein
MKKKLVAFKLFWIAIISLTVMISCVPQAKMKYLQDKEGETPVTEFKNLSPEYKLKPGDFVHIRVLSLDQKSNEIFSSIIATGGAGGYSNTTDQELYLKSYMVNDSGFISFPLFGNIQAGGLTIKEVEAKLSGSVAEIVQGASVVVKLVLYNISVLGEVKSPGKFTIYNNRINVFEALAMANDVTSFGNRSNIKIIRTEGAKTNIYVIDIQGKDILSSPYYHLQPNDIVYVEPLKEKSWKFETFPYALILSSVSLLLVVLTFFK